MYSTKLHSHAFAVLLKLLLGLKNIHHLTALRTPAECRGLK